MYNLSSTIILWLCLLTIMVVHIEAFSPSNRLASSRLFRSITTARHYKNFDEMLEQLEVPVLVDFYAQWCGPCVMMQPVLEDVAGRLENEAKVAKVDTDKSPRLGARYQVEALPTLILFFKGQVVDRYVGYRNADDLEREVRASMARLKNGAGLK
jgi:thioredoxin